MLRFALFVIAVFLQPATLRAVPVTDSASLQQALQDKQTTIELNPGTYRGNVLITYSTTLNCKTGAVLDADNQGDALRITAADVTVRGCTIINWGGDLTAMNAGIFVEQQAALSLIHI